MTGVMPGNIGHGALALTGSARAGASPPDMPLKSPSPFYVPPTRLYDWTGFYLGGHVGYGGGDSGPGHQSSPRAGRISSRTPLRA